MFVSTLKRCYPQQQSSSGSVSVSVPLSLALWLCLNHMVLFLQIHLQNSKYYCRILLENTKDTLFQNFFSSWHSLETVQLWQRNLTCKSSVPYPKRELWTPLFFSNCSFTGAFRKARGLFCIQYPTHCLFALVASWSALKWSAHSSNRYFTFPKMPLLSAHTSITHPKPTAQGFRRELESSSCVSLGMSDPSAASQPCRLSVSAHFGKAPSTFTSHQPCEFRHWASFQQLLPGTGGDGASSNTQIMFLPC